MFANSLENQITFNFVISKQISLAPAIDCNTYIDCSTLYSWLCFGGTRYQFSYLAYS